MLLMEEVEFSAGLDKHVAMQIRLRVFEFLLFVCLSLIIPDQPVHYHSSCHTFETPGVANCEELDVHLLRLSDVLWIRKPFQLLFQEKRATAWKH
jgi:hypothetical protein